MKHSKNAHLRWCIFMAGLFSVLNVFPINLEIKTKITPTESDNRYNESIILYDDVYYAMLGSQIQWQILYHDWESDKDIHDSLRVEYIISSNNNSEIQKDTLKNLNDLNAFQTFRKFPSTNEVGAYKILITPIRLTKNDKGEETFITLSESSKEIILNICHKSSYKPESDFAGGKTVVYEGINVTKEVKNDADNSLVGKQRWEFSWKMDDKTSKGEKWSETFSINEVRAEKKLELTATCYAPDGNSIWYEETFNHTYIVYEKPVLSIDLSTTEFREEGYEYKIIERNGISYLLEGNKERDIILSMKYDETKFNLSTVSYNIVSIDKGSTNSYSTKSLNLNQHNTGQYRIEIKNATWTLANNNNEELPSLSDTELPVREIVLREKPSVGTVTWDDQITHMLEGEKPAPLSIEAADDGSRDGTYTWYVNGEQTNNGDKTKWEHKDNFYCQNGEARTDKIVTLKVICQDTRYSDIKWYEKEYNYTYRVYGKPNVEFTQDIYSLCSEDIVNVDLDIEGGYDDGWDFIWSKNGSIIDLNKKNYQYAVRDNYTDTIFYDTIHVEFENKIPGIGSLYKESRTCYVKIYPHVISTIEISDSIRKSNEKNSNFRIYEGEVLNAVVQYDGSEKYGIWECKWYYDTPSEANEIDDSNVLFQNTDREYTISVKENKKFVCVTRYNLKEDGTTIKELKYELDVEVYTQPIINNNIPSSGKYFVIAGNTLPLITNPEGGYDKGWTFTWTVNDNVIAENMPQYTYSAKNENETPDTIIHTLSYSNVLDGKIGCKGEYTFTVIDYSTPIKSVKNLDYAQDVRQGDARTFSINAPMGGNPNGWYYKWKKDEEDITSEWIKWNDKNSGHIRNFVMELNEMTKDVKHSENHRYDFIYTNFDDEGNTLLAPDKIEFPVTVYQRPRKPAKIVQKGTGKSDLFILMYDDFEQEELEKADILFNFYMEDGEELYTGKERVIFFQASQNRLRARSLWKYDSGYDCYSDPVGMGIIDDTKAPDYIEAVNVDTNTNSLPMSVTVYSMTGEMLKRIEHVMQKEYNEAKMLQELPKGLYILHQVSGNQRVVKKVVVK